MEVIWKNTSPRECSERVKENAKGIQDKHTEVCRTAYIYEPCNNDCFGGFETGTLCLNLYANFVKLKSVLRMSMTLTFIISYSLQHAHQCSVEQTAL